MLTLTFSNFLLFAFFIFLIIFLPGFLFLSRIRQDITDSEKISLSLCLGIVLLVGLGIILGITHLRYLLLPVLLMMGLISVIKFRQLVFSPWIIFTKDKFLLVIILLGILVQGFINFPSGYHYDNGLLFWSSQGFDGFWHISIMEEIRKSFPPQIPVFAGEKLVNYHYLSDVLMGEFARIFPLFSSLDLYFRFFPALFSFLMGISVFSFMQRWQNKKIAYWAMFFTYFTGSFGYIITFLRNGQIFGGETVFWVSQLNTVVANPPHAVAISLLLSFLLAFLLFLQNKKNFWFLICLICGLSIAGFKVSGGVVLLTGVGALALIYLFSSRTFMPLFLFLLLVASNFLTIKLMTRGVEGYLIFEPWWFVRTMVVDKLGWMDLELRRQYYLSLKTSRGYLRVLQFETTAFVIYLVGNSGTRVIGLIGIFRKLFSKKYWTSQKLFEIGLLVMMLTGFLVPMFFLQKGIVYNIVQFMQYYLLFLGFFAAIAIESVIGKIKNKIFKLLLALLVIVFSVPTVIGNLVEFYGPGRSPLAIISNEELQALNYLKTNSSKDAIILAPTFNQYLNDKYNSQPIPIFAWYSTGYISGLTGRRTYLASEDMVIQTGFDYSSRLQTVNNFFNQMDSSEDRKFLKNEKISFIYFPKDQLEIPLDLVKNDLSLVFENAEVLIYKVD